MTMPGETNHETLLAGSVRSIISLAPALSHSERLGVELADIERATHRGYFTPDEDERVRLRFAEYLGARAALLQTIDDLKPIVARQNLDFDNPTRWRAFILAYASTAMLIKAGRFIVERYAPNKIVQRKLNEAEPRLGIPRKQFTSVYRSLTNPLNAWQISDAIKFADSHRREIVSLSSDPQMAPVLDLLQSAEASLRMNKRRYVKAYLRYRWHSWRRRRASAFGQTMFGLLEMAGRVISELHNPWHQKRVTPAIRDQLAALLQPGDVLLSRHDDAASNLFLPGYWVHAALHIGPEHARRELNVQVDPQRGARWIDPIRVLEAKKDGVLFRPLTETLSVDAVAVLRPQLDRAQLAAALSQAVTHEGKLYDFEFDFFRSDRLVCTEVVYRAYHGIGGIEFTLSPRAGRPTLAAEDLLAMALDNRGFEPVAVFGAPDCPDSLRLGSSAAESLLRSIRR